jgi:competence protein ComEC
MHRLDWSLQQFRWPLTGFGWPTLVLIFVAGTWTAQQQAELPTLALLWAMLAVAGGLLVLARWEGLRRAALTLAFALFGFAWASLNGVWALAGSVPSALEGKELLITGMVVAMPSQIERGQRFAFQVDHCSGCERDDQLRGQRLAVSWYNQQGDEFVDLKPVHPGERWSLNLRLKRRYGNFNPFGFDAELWLLERGFAGTASVRPDKPPAHPNRRLSDGTGWLATGWLVQIERLRDQTRERVVSALPGSETLPVLLALSLGDQQAVKPADWNTYAATGVTHLLAISGLHVTLFATLVGWLSWQGSTRWTWLIHRVPAPVLAWLGGWLAALSYALLAGFAVPAQRTVIMLTVVMVARLAAHRAHPAHVLASAGFLVLLHDPLAVLAPGTWFSFSAVAALMLTSAAAQAWAQAQTLAFLPEDGPTWKQRLGTVFSGHVGTQLAVTLGMVPLSVLFFGQFSLAGPLANLVAIPAVSYLVLPLTLLGCGLAWFSPLLAAPVLGLAAWLMGLLNALLRWLASGPWAILPLPHPPTAVFLLACGAVLLWFALGFLARGRRRHLALLGLLPLFLWPADRPAEGAWRVTFLDVGQGMAVLIQTHAYDWLYDTGPQLGPETDGGQRIIVPYLRAIGVRHLAGMLISHADNDHSGGAASILRAVSADWQATTLPPEHPARVAGVRHIACIAGLQWQSGPLTFETLHPPPEWLEMGDLKPNMLSCVLRISDGHRAVLLPGDLEADQELWLVRTVPEKLRANVLLAPHHGSKTSSTPEFLAAVQAQDAVFQAGYRNRFGHPREEILERYRDQGTQILRTDALGAVRYDFNASGIHVQAARPLLQRYWNTRFEASGDPVGVKSAVLR